MPLELLAEGILVTWSPEAIGALALTIGGILGAAMTWFTGRGTDWYIKISEWRLKRKERLSKINPPSQKSIDWKDQILEDKGLAVGYRAMLLSWNSRMQGLEDALASKTKEIQQLHTAYIDCLENHAQEKSRAERFDVELKNLHDSYSRLEQINEKYREKLSRTGEGINPYRPQEPQDG